MKLKIDQHVKPALEGYSAAFVHLLRLYFLVGLWELLKIVNYILKNYPLTNSETTTLQAETHSTVTLISFFEVFLYLQKLITSLIEGIEKEKKKESS